MKPITFIVEITPFGTEIQDEVQGKEVEDWPISGWSEGFRAVLTDITDGKSVFRKTIEIYDMSPDQVGSLMDVLINQIEQRFMTVHYDMLLSEISLNKILQLKNKES